MPRSTSKNGSAGGAGKTDTAIEVGLRIRQARKEAGGMSQRELADLLGVTERSVQAYERGEVIPHRYMEKLQSVLGRQTAWFYYGEEAMKAPAEHLEEFVNALDQRNELLIDALNDLRAEVSGLKAEVGRLKKALGRVTPA